MTGDVDALIVDAEQEVNAPFLDAQFVSGVLFYLHIKFLILCISLASPQSMHLLHLLILN